MHPVLTEKLAAERIREMVARGDAARPPVTPIVHVTVSGPGAARQPRITRQLRTAVTQPGPPRAGRPDR
jgi:hypothetical protein